MEPGQSSSPAEIDATLDRFERAIATGNQMLAAYREIGLVPGVNNTATASVASGNTLALVLGMIGLCILASMAWVSKRDREAADEVRKAQVEAVNSKWQADIATRDAAARIAAIERSAEILVMAEARRADMAELTALRGQVQSASDDIKGLRAYDARFTSELATIKAASNGK